MAAICVINISHNLKTGSKKLRLGSSYCNPRLLQVYQEPCLSFVFAQDHSVLFPEPLLHSCTWIFGFFTPTLSIKDLARSHKCGAKILGTILTN